MILSQILQKSFYVGDFTVDENNNVEFQTEYTRKDLISLGDLVYFMFVGDDLFTEDMLFKIGKAGGSNGFYGRSNMYKRGYLGDKTNKRILDVMQDYKDKIIRVFAVQSPRQKITVTCPVRGIDLEIEVETHGAIEKSLTDAYMNEDNTNFLPFCYQLK